jgi:catechol 2,3-dioxygenase-like lactoylglutathione lyase family enzyme
MDHFLFSERVLRVNDLERMKRFYRWILGFELVGEFPNAALLEMNVKGGTRVLTVGLFKQTASCKCAAAYRITVTLPRANCESRRKRLKRIGAAMEIRGRDRICIHDPEGNEIELVCQDEKPRPAI